MSNLTIFQFESNQVRIVTIDGEPWFVAADVLKAIGSSTTVSSLKRLVCEDLGQEFVTNHPLPTPGGTQNIVCISEAALTMFVSRSRTELGKQMNRWIHAEVLPSIRKTGSYNAQPQTSYYFDRLKQFLKDGKVPVGYFCVFRETLELVGDLEGKGCILPQSVTPDLSVGKCWANHLRSLGVDPKSVSIKYDHKFPNDTRGTVKPYAYEDHLLADFRKWFHQTYQTDKLPKYLKERYPDALPALSQLLGIPEQIILKLK